MSASLIAVLSTQFITTISALAYILSESLDKAPIRIYSLRHPSFHRHAELISLHLLPWCEARGLSCQFLFLDDVQHEPLRADLLITPRVDHRLSIAFIEQLRPAVVVETGESIGVEPRLYSLKSRFFRRSILERLRQESFLTSLVLAHAVKLSGCDLPMLGAFVQICSELRDPLSAGTESSLSLDLSTDQELILLLLPYLTHRKHKNLFHKSLHRIRRRVRLLNRPERSFPHPALRQAARSIAHQQSNSSSHMATTIYLKPHPKNQSQTELICNSLRRFLEPSLPVTILPLSAELPLEQLVAHLPLTAEPTQFRILGFGTNLLAAKVFLFPSPLTISLVEMERPAAMRVFAHAFDFLVHRTEFLRRRHVSRLLTSLNAGLESIRLQPSAGAGSR